MCRRQHARRTQDPGSDPQPCVAGTLLAIRKVDQVVGVQRGLESLRFDDVGGKPSA
jgi:hypothetical protein